jgi:tRNA A-37 threonylcarbamoyl transferase component Bud32
MKVKTDLRELGYVTYQENSVILIYRSSLPELRHLAGVRGPLGENTYMSGRSSIRIIKPDMVVRTLVHGGLFRHITGKNFISPARSLRELEISAYLKSQGIPTPEMLAVRVQRKKLFYHIEVISRLIPDSMDLLAYLETPHDNSREMIKEAGILIRKIHLLGVYHADLHVKNLLLDSNKSLCVLDLDKAIRFDTLPDFLQRLNVRRFVRSLKKWQEKGRIPLPDAWKESFMEGYGTSP